MHHPHWRAGFIAALIAVAPVQAQTLRQALEAAWDKQPAQRAQSARQNELDAKLRAAGALTPEPASVTLAQRNDRIGSNLGQREWEIELAAPIWLPGQRARQQALVQAEDGAFGAAQSLAKWRLAGELRELWWQARLAEAERDLAGQRVASAAALAADVERRVKAGDLAKVDANRARGEEQSARIALGEADVRAYRALQQFTALTGIAGLPLQAEQAAAAPALEHPQRVAAQQQLTLAQRRVGYASATRRDAPELSLALTRERGTFDERYGNSLMLRLKIPFATDARNQPRLAAAQAELAEADAAQALDGARLDAEAASARRELERAQAALKLSAARVELARESHQLQERAFKLGELDLSSRLRAEAERFEAERNLVKAGLEAGYAISKLNQALGVLP